MSADGIDIIATADGSHSLRHQHLDETYHSRHGAIQESNHVFIHHGLECWRPKGENQECRILEVGFGTGLNALLSLQESLRMHEPIAYTSLEAFPVPESLARQLNYPELLSMPNGSMLFERLHAACWNVTEKITPGFSLKKIEGTIQMLDLPAAYFDIVFFDAFAPSKQPEMWELPVLKKVVQAMGQGSIFVTYCAKGQLKRDLKALGLTVESLPGPPGKREMVRARRLSIL